MPASRRRKPIPAEFLWLLSSGGYSWQNGTSTTGIVGRWLVMEPETVEVAPRVVASIVADRALNSRSYQPLREYTGLFRIFAKTKPTEEGVLAFANRFGGLFSESAEDNPHGRVYLGSKPPSDPRYFLHGEQLEQWAAAIGEMQRIVSLWDAIKAGDDSWLRSMLPDIPYFADVPTSSVPYRAWAWLAYLLNERLGRHAAPEFLYRLQPQPTTHIWLGPKNLLGALWIQAAVAVHERQEFRTCARCGDPYALPRTAPKGGGRTEAKFCSARCRVAAYRERKDKARKLRKKGTPHAAIAKQLGTDTKTVRGWLARN